MRVALSNNDAAKASGDAAKFYDLPVMVRLNIINLVVWVVTIVGFFYLKSVTDIDKVKQLRPPPYIVSLVFIGFIFLIPIVGFWVSFRLLWIYLLFLKGIVPDKVNTKYGKNLSRWHLVVSIAAFTSVILPLLYISGFTEKVGTFLKSHLPLIGSKVSEAISYIFTVIVSGVLGNFAYDVIKRVVTRLVKTNKGSKK